MTLLGRLAKALGALALTVGISAGIPWALLTYIGSPIPKHVPTMTTVSGWLSTRFDIHTFLAIAVYLLWLSWVVFVAQLLVQVPGVIGDLIRILSHREPLRRDAAGGPGGTLARGLIAAFTIALLAPRSVTPQAVAKAATDYGYSGSSRSVAVAPAVPGARTAPEPPSAPAEAAVQADRAGKYVVESGDTLWDIAEAKLGKASRWLEIFDLNRGRPQADRRMLNNPQVILPGWVLELPQVSSAPVVAPDVSVQHGHAHMSVAVVAAPSSHDTAPNTQPSSAAGPVQVRTTPHVSSSKVSAAARTKPFVAPRDRTGVELPGGGYVGIGLASGVAASLAFIRLRNRSQARFQHVTQACGLDPVLPAPRGSAAALERAHQLTLCAPGRGYFQDEEDFVEDPYVDDDELSTNELVDQPALELVNLDLVEVPADQLGPAPYSPSFYSLVQALEAPTEISIGTCGNVAVPLATATGGGLSLTGGEAASVARAILLSALAAGGAGESRQAVMVSVTASLLEQLLGPGSTIPEAERLEVVEDPDRLVANLMTEAGARAQIVAEYGYSSAAEVRRFTNECPFSPLVLLADSSVVGLQDLASAGRAVDVHVVGIGPWSAETTLEVGTTQTTATGAASGDLGGLRPFTLSASEANELLHVVLTVPRTAAEPFTDAETLAPTAPRPVSMDDDGWEPASLREHERTAFRVQAAPGTVVLNLMGPFSAFIDDRDVSHIIRPGSRTLLLYLALHPRGVSRAKAAETLWPEAELHLRTTSFDSALSVARKQLREAAGASRQFIVGERGSGTVRLNPAVVVTDFVYFDGLITKAAATRDDEAKIAGLQAACALYRGPIDESIRGDWLLDPREDRLRRYRDAVGDLARIYSHNDPDRCLDTLNELLNQDLVNEDLYRRIMVAQAHLGRRDAVRRTLNLLDVRYESAGFDVDPSTYALADELTRKPKPRSSPPSVIQAHRLR